LNKRLLRLIVCLTLGTGPVTVAWAQQRPALFGVVVRDRAGAHRPERDVVRGRNVELHLEALQTAIAQRTGIALPLFPNLSVNADPDRIDQLGPGRYVWKGHLVGIENGEATFAVTDGVLTGQITFPGGQYRVHLSADGGYSVEEIDSSVLPSERPPIAPDVSSGGTGTASPAPAVANDGPTIDVMVVYTPAARAAVGSVAAINSLVDLAVANANTSYSNSGVVQRLRLVYRGEVAYTENTGNMGADLVHLQDPSDGYIDQIHALRNTYAADFVSLLTTGTDACGIGYLMTNVSTSFAPYAFNVTAWNCAAGNLSLAHELGHNMGLQHDSANAGGAGAYSYAYGYRDPGFFRTVMAYPCENQGLSSCPRVTQFSSPNYTYGGRVTGVSGAADNAQALNNTLSTTANFRTAIVTPVCTFSLSPTGASPSSAATTGNITVTASDSSCAWSAVSNAGFLIITSSSGGAGSATVSYAVAANTGTSARNGTLTIAGQTFTVLQAAAARRVPGDYNGDGIADVGIFRPESALWSIQGRPPTQWGAQGDLPVPGDYSGDGIPDLAVFRPSNSTWYIAGASAVAYGLPGDIPVPGDYDGNGTTDIAVFRPSAGQWLVRNIGVFAWGVAGDLPVPGDYNGDGIDDIAVWRPSNGTWYVRNGSTTVWGAAGDVPVPADYNGDGIIDLAVFRRATGIWYVKDQFTQTWGRAGDVPVALDRNGDRRVELGVFRPAAGIWYFLNTSTGAIENVTAGQSGDIPLGRPMPAVQTTTGDYDGDRKGDLTVFRPSTGDWVSLRSLSGQSDYTVRSFGSSADTPVGRDYDGDGRFDPAIYRASTGMWYVLQSSTNFSAYVSQEWGLSADTPVPADYDGDGKADFAVFRPSLGRWVILLSSTGNASYVQYDWGLDGDVPMPADYDGDGRADVAVFRPSTNRWYILNRLTGASTIYDWGLSGDAPAAADFDGDGKADIAVFRPSLGRWFIKSSIDGSYTTADWGLSGDILVPADYNGDGFADVAVYRPSNGTWYVRGLFNRTWGQTGDVPALRNP
jgi:hypothetical protein